MTESTDRAGDRIAKVIARAGLASRRDAEKMVADLRVAVNGKTVSNVAHNVVDGDKVTVDGAPLPRADGARLWLYHKPAGLVTTEKDEKDRETVFDALPEELGRVLSVGRLDLNSEGLLLLTNDGGLKRKLELPSTGWLRRYRVRVNGKPDDAALERLRSGITVEGDDGPETFAGMDIVFDRQQGANAWLTVGLREGRNREIRRAFSAVDMYVNRLIRVSYGPFQLGNLPAGEVEEIKPRVVKEQLGATWDGELAETRMAAPEETKDARAGKDGGGSAKGRKPRPSGDRLVDHGRGSDRTDPSRGDDRKKAPRGDDRTKAPRGGDSTKAPRGGDRKDAPRDKGPAKPRTGSPAEARVARAAAKGDRPRTAKPPVTRNDGDGARPARDSRPGRDGPRTFGAKPARKTWEGNPDRPDREGDRAPWAKDDGGARADRKPRPGSDRPDEKPKETKSERTARMRGDTSVSLRKGGQRGRGIAKPKKAPSTKRMKKPGDAED